MMQKVFWCSVAEMTSSTGETFTYGYDNYGRFCKIIRADGSTETREYDTAGQLTRQTDKDKEGNILQVHSYTYDVFAKWSQRRAAIPRIWMCWKASA